MFLLFHQYYLLLGTLGHLHLDRMNPLSYLVPHLSSHLPHRFIKFLFDINQIINLVSIQSCFLYYLLFQIMIDSYSLYDCFYPEITFKLNLFYFNSFILVIYFNQLPKIWMINCYFTKLHFNCFVYLQEPLFQTLHSFLIYLLLLFAFDRIVFVLITIISFFNLLLEKLNCFIEIKFSRRRLLEIDSLTVTFTFLDIQDLWITFQERMYTLPPFFQIHNLLLFYHFYLIVFFFINTISQNEHFLLVITSDS